MDKEIQDSIIDEWNETPVRPWSRLFATYIDVVIINYLLAVIFDITFGEDVYSFVIFIIYYAAVVVVTVYALAFSLSQSGTTPGKWFFGIRVEDKDGGVPDYDAVVKREWRLIIYGFALFIPIANLVAHFMNRSRLMETGNVSWDADNGLRTLYKKRSTTQLVKQAIGVLIFFIILFTVLIPE